MKKINGLLLTLFGLALPFLSRADLLSGGDCQVGLGQACTTSSVHQLVIVVIDMLLGVAGLVAVLFIIIGGFQYITSAGNEELAERGKKNLQNAVIGIVIIVLSYVIVRVVSTFFGVN
ncbi:MAG: pilin [Candidatus Doudnabacteria bacterium]